MILGLYHGLSPISRIIRRATRSDVSHVAMVDESTGETWEAWHVSDDRRWLGGHFRKVPTPWAGHDPRTPIDFYGIKGMTPGVHSAIRATCERWAVEKIPYDYLAILRFITRSTRADGPERMMCMEAAIIAFANAGLPFLNAPPSRAAPCHVLWSPLRYHIPRPLFLAPNPT